MIVPSFWAEASLPYHNGKRQVTIRRFGWSDASYDEAYGMAELRAKEAIERLTQGETVRLREKKVAYHADESLPIREEILSRQGSEIITRNSYGAHCLNTPHALFADVDFEFPSYIKLKLISYLFVFLASLSIAYWYQNIVLLIICFVILGFMNGYLVSFIERFLKSKQAHPKERTKALILNFLKQHPSWGVRLYQTPKGMRVLVTHQCFEPNAAEVKAFFEHIGVDPLYAKLCFKQNCFRARLTAKPWRIGIKERMKPSPGVWPIDPRFLGIRQQWVNDYERKASHYAACHYLESLGATTLDYQIHQVIQLHDRECRATQYHLPLA